MLKFLADLDCVHNNGRINDIVGQVVDRINIRFVSNAACFNFFGPILKEVLSVVMSSSTSRVRPSPNAATYFDIFVFSVE